MKERKLPLLPQAFELIKSGRKKIEGRAPDIDIPAKNYKHMNRDDILVFIKEDETNEIIKYTISDINHYSSVEEMLKYENIKIVSPLENDSEKIITKYHSFPWYKERIKKYGIYAIHIWKRLK